MSWPATDVGRQPFSSQRQRPANDDPAQQSHLWPACDASETLSHDRIFDFLTTGDPPRRSLAVGPEGEGHKSEHRRQQPGFLAFSRCHGLSRPDSTTTLYCDILHNMDLFVNVSIIGRVMVYQRSEHDEDPGY
jgi:hypothetical protein